MGGEVLEIGFGTGLNLPHYPEHVRRITTVDPNPGMNRLARRRIAEAGIAVDQRALSGEALPFEDESFDCVVSTWTLCSIPDAGRALGEVHRVLGRAAGSSSWSTASARIPGSSGGSGGSTRSSGCWATAAVSTWTCRLSSAAGPSPASTSSGSRWSGCPGRTGRCIVGWRPSNREASVAAALDLELIFDRLDALGEVTARPYPSSQPTRG